MILIDKLAYSSKIRFESPYLKCFFAIANLVICMTTASFTVSIIMILIMGGCAVYFSRASFSYYIKLMLIPAVFLLFSTITIVLNLSKIPFDLFAFPIGNYYITGSVQSFWMGINLMVKAFGCVSCLYFLILTTPMIDLLEVLRRLRVPSIIIELMMLMYRFIFVLLDMGNAILTAQNCRLGHKDIKSSITSMGHMLAVLLVRAYQKSDCIYNSMEARGYDGHLKVVICMKKANPTHTLSVVFIEICMVGLAILCTYYHI
ncbi:MAG: cobalt ECF transporter T component CbiQ [Lachnospiraceae bacterium]